MSIVLPDTADIESFGGLKSNAVPIVDPTTDEDAADRNAAFANIAAMTHTAWRAWYSFVADATSYDEPGAHVHDAVWGGDVSVKPAVIRLSTGKYKVTWPVTVPDQLGVSHTLNIRRAWAIMSTVVDNDFPLVYAWVTAQNEVTVRMYNASTAPPVFADMTSGIVTVFIL